MCSKEKAAPLSATEDLLLKQLELEEENKFLWDEVRNKRQEIDSLNDKLFLQRDLLKNRCELKKNLAEYQRTIASLQDAFIFAKRENAILEEKLRQCWAATALSKGAEKCGGDGAHKQVAHENMAFRHRVHLLERELRRCRFVFGQTRQVSQEIATGRETIAKLEQKLLEYQPLATDCKQAKSALTETEQKLNSLIYSNNVLKDELEQRKGKLEQLQAVELEMKAQLDKYLAEMVKLRKENGAMEKFVERSFQLEGMLAELEDVTLVIRKQEGMLRVLFDENQNLKEGMGRLFEDMNEVKQRNWNLEKYAGEIEDTFYTAEKNVGDLEQKLQYYRQIEVDNEKMRKAAGDLSSEMKRLKLECVQHSRDNDAMRKKYESLAYDAAAIKEDNVKLANENKTLRNAVRNRTLELAKEKDNLKLEYDRQAVELNKLKRMQRQYVDSQEFLHSFRDQMKGLLKENDRLRNELEKRNAELASLRADRERYLQELGHISQKCIQLQDDLAQMKNAQLYTAQYR